ncbi:MAG TPA: amidase [Chloroflexia bacterium]|nr:amidase [Chloroflexia bacterium]
MSQIEHTGFPGDELQEVTIEQLQAALEKGELTSLELVRTYKARIEALDWAGPGLHSVIELNPDAEEIAQELDQERKTKGPRGPLHGLPILIKDNIDTADKMQTTAGSLALLGSKPQKDAFVVQKLREAGAIILGKTNLSEWANFRSTHSSSGWSGRGGQTHNPYILTHNPCGSSSGSGVAVSANLCVAALATETDGSIVCPAHMNGVVGIKPTVGLLSRSGVVPISHSQDTVGVHARTVRDAATVLGTMTGIDSQDEATASSEGKFYSDYTQFLEADSLKGVRIGVLRKFFSGYNSHTDAVFEKAIASLRELGAEIVDPADLPTGEEIKNSQDEVTVLTYEFKATLNAYLNTRVPDPNHPEGKVVRSLEEVMAFNQENAEQELNYFGQEIMEMSQARGPLTEEEYLTALANNRRRGGKEGIDAVLAEHQLTALIAPTGQPAWPIDLLNGDHFGGASSSPAAIAGYPLVTVPAGYVSGLPVGLTFMAGAYSEPALIKLAYAFEQATKARQIPRYLPSFQMPQPAK